MYQVSVTVANGSIDDDEFPANNTWGIEFETTENTYSRVRHGQEDDFGLASPRDWVGGGN